ncbi:MAG: dNTP triphosphohydrolase [Acidobacteria bacterium]|nr:dNTP triphosphohydrolase [Acidobacteriota bacterium]
MLGALRFPVERSRGRRYPEPPHAYRNPFQRDRDRIVHSRAFRRLEAKTQVFAPGISDHFRNRLTHTIEVAQIARTVAAALDLDQDFTEALALAHDIGHPPFSHAGEAELDLQMRRFGEGFDHNLHALRIVETFEQRYARFPGLNLTFEVREGIVKHSREIASDDAAELAEYLPGERPPLEAQLIDLADEIAYNSADLDDAFSAGIITAASAASECSSYARVYETVEQQFPGASERERFHEALRQLIDFLVSGLIGGTLEQASASGAGCSEDVRALPRRIAAFTAPAVAASRELKMFLTRRVYSSQALEADRRRARQRLGELFGFFLADPERLPPPYRESIARQPAHRVVCDYLAGMTDQYFDRTYQQTLGGIRVS